MRLLGILLLGIVPCIGMLAQATNLNPQITQSLESISSDEEAIIAQAHTLNQAYLEHLTYLYARLEKPLVAEPLASIALKQDPKNERLLRAMASMYLALAKAEKTMFYAKRILEHYPKDQDGLFFLATAHQIANQPQQARHILLEMKIHHSSPKPYPFELDLASAANQSGDWRGAMDSYITILRDYELTPELRQDVRNALDSIYRTHKPQGALRVGRIRSDTGVTTNLDSLYSQAISTRTRIFVEVGHREVELTSSAEFVQATSKAEQARIVVSHKLNRQYNLEVWAGRYANNHRFGIRLTRIFNDNDKVSLAHSVGDPALDSLSTGFLKAHENRTNIYGSFQLPYQLTAQGNAFYRTVEINQHKLGSGVGVDWQLTRPERLWDADWYLSWRGAYTRFHYASDDTALVQNLPLRPTVTPTGETVRGLTSQHIHRQGSSLSIIKNMNDVWVIDLTLGADYYFFLKQLAYDAGIGLLYRPRKSVEVTGDVIYSSVDSTGNQNTENVEVILGLKKYF